MDLGIGLATCRAGTPGAPAAAAAKSVEVFETPDTNPKNPVNIQGRKVILEAIYRAVGDDGLANDKLYNAVKRARSIGLVANVPFAPARTNIMPEQVAQFKAGFALPGVKRLCEDPTVRFVVLGFADNPGDTDANAALAKKRADLVHDLIRKDCGVVNVTNPLAVRDWLTDPLIHTRDYALEVWVILP